MADSHLSEARKWGITFAVMPLTVMQILDTSVTNVALPHIQGSLSAGVEEVSWVITSFLAANVFVPMTTLALARITPIHLPHASAAFCVVRNIGGSIGIAVSTTLLSRRSQFHQTTLVSHVNVWDGETADRLRQWTAHFASQGADAFTAARRALPMVHRSVLEQAQVLAYVEEFRLLAIVFVVGMCVLPLMRRVRIEPVRRGDAVARDEGLPAPVE